MSDRLKHALLRSTALMAPSTVRVRGHAPSIVKLALLASVAAGPAAAQSTWIGTTGDWNTGANWSPIAVPSSSDTANFGAGPLSGVFTTADTSIGQIIFGPGATSYTLTLGNNLTINTGVVNVSGVNQTIATGSGPSNTIFVSGATGDHVTYDLAAGGNVILDGSSSGGNSTFNLGGGGRLALRGSAPMVTIGSLSGIGGRVENFSGAPAALAIGSLNTSTSFGGAFIETSGSISIGKVGTGTLTLSGVNTYTGATTVSAGTLAAGRANAFSAGSTTTVNAGGILDLSGFNQSIGSLAGSGAVTLGGGTLTTGSDNNSTTFSGVISQAGGLVKLGSGALTLSGANTYSGGTSLNAGTLVMNNGSALGTGTLSLNGGTLKIDGGIFANTNSVLITNAGGTVDVATGSLDLSGNITDGAGGAAGTLTITSSGGLGTVAFGGNNTYSAATHVQANTILGAGSSMAFSGRSHHDVDGILVLAGFSNSVASLAGTGTVVNGNPTAAALTIAPAAGTTTFSGRIEDGGAGALSLVKAGAGTQVLAGTNTYTGGTSLNAGTLVMNNNSALGTGTLTLNGGALRNGGAILSVNNAVQITSAGGTFHTAMGTMRMTGNITDGAGGAAGTLTIASSGGLGTVVLYGNNTYSAATHVQANTALVASSSTAFSAMSHHVVDGALYLGGYSNSIASLSGSGAVANGNGTAATLTIAPASGTATFGGFFVDAAGGGALSLVKTGAGTQVLSGTNTYTGATAVTGGTLVVNGSIASSASLTVAAGATIGGSGTLPSTTVNGTVAPGNSPGTLTINGNLTLGAGSLYLAEVQGAASDRLDVSGTASLAGTLRIVPLGGAYLFSSPYTLLSAAGGLGGSSFGTVDTSASFGDGVTRTVSYTGTEVQLTLTPKPLAPIVTPPVAPSGPGSLGVGRPANAVAVASAIDAVVANGANPSALFAIYNLPAAAIPAAVNQLSGEVHTSAPAMANSAAGQFLGTMLDGSGAGRLSGAPGGPAGATGFTADLPSRQDGPGRQSFDPARFSLWGATFGSTGRNDGDRIVGSANRNLSDAHLAVGADIRLGTNTVVGAAVSGGQSRASLSAGLGKAEADVFQAGLYGRTLVGSVNLAAALGYARLDTDTNRAIPALGLTGVTASYATQAWSGRVEASLPVMSWSGITLSPLAAFQAVHASSPAAMERATTGAVAGTLTLASRSDMTSRSELGLQLDANLMAGAMPVTGFVRGAWAHYFQRDFDLGASLNGLPGASFAVTGARPDRNAALVTAGADIRLSQTVSLGMRVDTELSANTSRLGGTAQLRVSF
ncbi:autotransporter outer membrane beta-barrel domain-containing protein [Bosea sp. NPDC055353]